MTRRDKNKTSKAQDALSDSVAASNGKGDSTIEPEKNKGGAPRENRNNLRHGLRAGQLPAGCKYIEHRLNKFRRQLEDALLDLKGGVSLQDAASILTVLRWERHGCLASSWLNKQYQELKPLERLNFSKEIAKASTERDRALRLLGLDKSEMVDAWDKLDTVETTAKRITDNGDLEDK